MTEKQNVSWIVMNKFNIVTYHFVDFHVKARGFLILEYAPFRLTVLLMGKSGMSGQIHSMSHYYRILFIILYF